MKSLTIFLARIGLTANIVSLVFILALIGSVNGGASGIRTQNKPQEEDILVKKSSYPNEPIQIVKVKNKKGKINLNKSFKDDPTEVLREFAITVNNSSGKNITHLDFFLFFPRTDKAESSEDGSYTFELTFGVSPLSEHYGQYRKLNPTKLIKKNETFELALTDEEYDHIIKVLNSLGYPPKIKKVEIWVNEVGFEDGTTWKSGRMFQNGESELNELRRPRSAPREGFFLPTPLCG